MHTLCQCDSCPPPQFRKLFPGKFGNGGKIAVHKRTVRKCACFLERKQSQPYKQVRHAIKLEIESELPVKARINNFYIP